MSPFATARARHPPEGRTRIPIANVYYLLCYAWDRLEEGSLVDVSALPDAPLPDLFAIVLARGIAHLLRRGMDRGYVEHTEALRGVRGRIAIAPSVKRATRAAGGIVCVFDELSVDVAQNQVLKMTVRSLLRTSALGAEIREELAAVDRRMQAVSEVRTAAHAARNVQLHRNNRFYAFLLDICALIRDNLFVSEDDGATRFRDFLQDEPAMARLFERFVLNFYRRELPGYHVRSQVIPWHQAEGSAEDLAYLPQMRTDITLTSPERVLVIDTKFYPQALKGQFREKVQSPHLYQLFAYVKNLQASSVSPAVEGILLYPTVRDQVDLRYRIGGHPLAVRTIDLDQGWRMVHRDLLRFVASDEPSQPRVRTA